MYNGLSSEIFFTFRPSSVTVNSFHTLDLPRTTGLVGSGGLLVADDKLADGDDNVEVDAAAEPVAVTYMWSLPLTLEIKSGALIFEWISIFNF